MKKFSWVALGLILVSGQALAFKCGNRLVDIGDSRSEVLKNCGAPETHQSYDNSVLVSMEPDPLNPDMQQQIVQQVHVEVWTYNFGSNRFVKRLSFENGILKRIDSLSYGYD